MKRLVLLLLAITSACSAQVEHSGLCIPGDGAVNVVRSSSTPFYNANRDGLVVELLPENYLPNPFATAQWLNTGSWGGSFDQTTETAKPSVGNGYVTFYSETTGGQAQTLKITPPEALSTFTVILAIGRFNSYPSDPTLILDQETTRPLLAWRYTGTSDITAYGNGSNKSILRQFDSPATPSVVIAACWAQNNTSYIRANDGNSTGDLTPISMSTAKPYFFGSRYSETYGLRGDVYYFAIYSRKLSDAEVDAIKSQVVSKLDMPTGTR